MKRPLMLSLVLAVLYAASASAADAHERGHRRRAARPDAHVSVLGGSGLHGAFGDGHTYAEQSESDVPMTVSNITEAVEAASSECPTFWYGNTNLALEKDGIVKSWGYGGEGQLGNGQGEVWEQDTPVQVSGLGFVVQVVEGCMWAMARLSNGEAVAWGWGGNGVLGDGSTTSSDTPVHVQLPGPAEWIAAGYGHALAVVNGVVYGWGEGGNGDIGPHGSSLVPVEVGVSNALKVAAGEGSSTILLKDGTVRTLGCMEEGQLGYGNYAEDWDRCDQATPVQPAISEVVEVSADTNHTLARTREGTIYYWGERQWTPTSLGCCYSGIAAGARWYVAEREGRIYTNGSNEEGSLGVGSFAPQGVGWHEVTGLGVLTPGPAGAAVMATGATPQITTLSKFTATLHSAGGQTVNLAGSATGNVAQHGQISAHLSGSPTFMHIGGNTLGVEVTGTLTGTDDPGATRGELAMSLHVTSFNLTNELSRAFHIDCEAPIEGSLTGTTLTLTGWAIVGSFKCATHAERRMQEPMLDAQLGGTGSVTATLE